MADTAAATAADDAATAASAAADDAGADGAADDGRVAKDDDWKTKARKHENEAKRLRREHEQALARLAEIENASKTDQERALEQARKEAAEAAKAETATAYQEKLVGAEIRAQAAGKFANPKLAARLLDLNASELLTDDGDVDTDQIAQAIDDFLSQEENAGLRAGTTNVRRPLGDADAGRGTGGAGGDMNDFIRTGARRG